jgi:DUF4097 and DUF4098 domain-containing protein YvlB
MTERFWPSIEVVAVLELVRRRFSASVVTALFVASLRVAAAAEPGMSIATQGDASFTRTLKVGPSGALDLSNVSGDIEIRGGPGDAIEIAAQKDGDPSVVDIDVSQTADRVRVETRYKRGTDGASVDFTVTVPAGTTVSARSVSGDVSVHDVTGEIRAESVSGDVTVSNAGNLLLAKSVSGDLTIQSATSREEPEISSVSGDVVVSELSARGVTVSSVSGDVVLTDADCERASLESMSGAIRYGGTIAPGGRYEFQSHSGNVELRIANDIGFELEAKTFSGRIESDFPVTPNAEGLGEGEVRGVYGDGSALVQASTFSGNVSITRE